MLKYKPVLKIYVHGLNIFHDVKCKGKMMQWNNCKYPREKLSHTVNSDKIQKISPKYAFKIC